MRQAGEKDLKNQMVHKADPAHRRRMQVWLALAVVIGAGALFGLHLWLGRLEATVGEADVESYFRWLSRIIAGVALMFAVVAFATGIWLYRLAEASLRDRRWPPLDYRSSSDLRIRYLTSADAFIGNLRLGAYGLYAIATGLVLWAAWLALAR